jgi:hypothetical protein
MDDIVPNMNKLKPDEWPSSVWQAVGSALSFWEAAEINLAGLYLIFKGKPRNIPNLIAYGEKSAVFSGRLLKLQDAAEQYFVRKPDQAKEGEFRQLVERATLLSKYRHQIAHGIVMKTNPRGWWWLVPPWYTEKLNYSGNVWFYCAGQIDGIATHFTALQAQANNL